MNPSGIYITWDHRTAWIHYAGEQAGESHAEFIVPSNPEYLKKLAKEFSKLAKKIEAERGN